MSRFRLGVVAAQAGPVLLTSSLGPEPLVSAPMHPLWLLRKRVREISASA
jgi:hypothetical protein